MGSETTREPDHGPVRQFSIFVENKVGRLNELVQSLGSADVHIMALCLVDTTDSTIIRIVVDYPERAEAVLNEHNFAHDRDDRTPVGGAAEGRHFDPTQGRD